MVTTAADKHGQQLHVGDTVEAYVDGQRHEAVVEKILLDQHNILSIVLKAEHTIPAGLVQLIKKPGPKKPRTTKPRKPRTTRKAPQ